jgi:uncharacterized protein (DUF2141 family)
MWKHLSAFLTTAICLLANTATQSPTGLVVGQTVDATSGKPIGGAMVTLSPAGPPPPSGADAAPRAPALPQRVMADDNGGFVFTNLAAGSYAITTTRGGFADGAYGQRRPNGPSLTLDLRADERLGDVTIRMWKFATITGTITDEANEPVVGARVRTLRQVFVAGRRRLGSASTATTDDRGVYRFGDLLPGDYVVAVTSSGTGSAMIAAPPPGDNGRLAVYPNTFYPDIAGSLQANAITLGSGEVRSGVDLHLRPVSAVRVSGTLTGPDGPVAMQSVQLSPAASAEDLLAETGFEEATAITDRNGVFTLSAVPSGQYVLRAVKTPIPGRRGLAPPARGPAPVPTDPTLWVAEPVVVGDQDVAIAVTMRLGLRVTGRFMFEGTTPTPTAERLRQIPVTVERVDARPTVSSSFLPPGQSDDTGAFTTYGLPGGRYVVRIGGSPAGWAFKSAMLDGKDVADTGFDLRNNVADVVITFTDKTTTISGSVHTTGGSPDPNAIALLFPADPAGWVDFGLNPRRLRSARVGANGSYSFSDAPAGDYFLVAIPDETAAEWREPKSLETLSRLATRVHLTDGETLTKDLRTVVVR